MMKHTLVIILVAALFSCTQNTRVTIKTIKIFNSKGKYIGDSVLNDGLLQKIVFKDSSLIIDSIVFYRYDNDAHSIQAKFTYMGGERVFENVEYYENGQVSKYSFIDEEKPGYFYERNYDTSGKLSESRGEVFFQGYIAGLNFKTLEVQQGTDLKIQIFHPNPPDCNATLFVKLEDGSNAEVFKRNERIPFLQSVFTSNNQTSGATWIEISVWLQLNEKFPQKPTLYNRSFFYKVVKR